MNVEVETKFAYHPCNEDGMLLLSKKNKRWNVNGFIVLRIMTFFDCSEGMNPKFS